MKTSPVHVETLATRKIFSFHPSHLSECPPRAECCRGHRDERDAAYALGNPWSFAVGTQVSRAARAQFPREEQRWRKGPYRPGPWCLLSASPGKIASNGTRHRTALATWIPRSSPGSLRCRVPEENQEGSKRASKRPKRVIEIWARKHMLLMHRKQAQAFTPSLLTALRTPF